MVLPHAHPHSPWNIATNTLLTPKRCRRRPCFISLSRPQPRKVWFTTDRSTSVAIGDESLSPSSGSDDRNPQAIRTSIEAPSRTEDRVVALLREKFGVPRVDLNQHFLDLGGDSYTATQLMARVSAEFGIDFSPILPFESATLSELIARIEAIREQI